MRILNAHIYWMMSGEYFRRPLAQEIEIGMGVAVWVGLVFVVVHFGGLTAI